MNNANRALQKKAAEKKESEQAKAKIIQVDDLLSFRQFSKKAADDVIGASGTAEVQRIRRQLNALVKDGRADKIAGARTAGGAERDRWRLADSTEWAVTGGTTS